LDTDLSDAHGDGGALLAGEVVLTLCNVRAHVVENAHLPLNRMQGAVILTLLGIFGNLAAKL
jgi:hypothetical protein